MRTRSRRVVYAVLLALACVNFAFRYPTSEHEAGADSFVFHGLAQTVLDSGRAAWLLNPLSLLGLYPLSHPSGSILIVSGIAGVGGIPAEGAILLFDMMTTLVGLLGAFMMAREIRPDDRLALLVALLFSTAPRFISSLEWEVPTRSLFTALMPLFVWSVLRLHRHVDALHLSLLATILVVMMSAHRLTVMMAIVLVAYIAASILVVALRILRTRYASTFLAPRLRRVLRLGSWGIVSIGLLYFLLFSGVLPAYTSGQLGAGSNAASQLWNLSVSLARSAGLLLPFVVLGVLSVARSRIHDVRGPWLIAILVGFMPTLSLRQYTGWYLVPFAAIFIGLGILYLYGFLSMRPRLRLAFAAAVVCASLTSSAVIVGYEKSVEQYLPSPVYDGAVYLRYADHATFLSNSGLLGVQVHAISGFPYMPIGGATTSAQGPEILAFGFMESSDVIPRLIPLGSLTIEDDSFFVLDGVNFEVIWADTLSRPLGTTYVDRQLTQYDVEYLIARKDLVDRFEAYGNVYASPFVASVAAQQYAIFDSSSLTVYYLQTTRS
jgi:hypothetical protein